MTPELKNELLTLLREKQSLILAGNEPTHDYQSLQARVLEEELREETTALIALLESDDTNFIESFKTRCKERARRNANSCLSLLAMPNGECNQLYLTITSTLFEPKTVSDLFSVLLPEVTTHVTHEIILPEPPIKPSNKHINIKLIDEPIDTLQESLDLNRLKSFVIAGSRLFDVKNIALFDIDLHKTNYLEMRRSHRDLALKLYQHNPALRKLANQLLMLSGNGQKPKEVINAFIKELRLGGEKKTGSAYASLQAQQSFTDFNGYLASLPVDLHNALLTLKDAAGRKSIDDVIKHLTGANLVEKAANYLQDIIENPVNQNVLTTHPHVPNDFLASIEKQYKRGTPLPTAFDGGTITLPTHYLEKVLARIQIHTTYDYVSLLLSFPETLYTPLLQKADIKSKPPLPIALAEMIKMGMLNQEQRRAFDQALLANQDKFGGVHELLRFAVNSDNVELINLFLESKQPKLSLAVLKKENRCCTVLLRAAYNPKFLLSILTSFSELDRLDVLKEKNIFGETMLTFIAHNHPELLQSILTSLPEKERYAALKIIYGNSNAVLHTAARHAPNSLQTILALFPEPERLAVVKEKNVFGETVMLHVADNHPELLQSILTLLPKEDRYVALNGDIILQTVARFAPNSLQTILALLSEPERVALVKKKDGWGDTLFHNAAHQPKSLQSILVLLPKQEWLTLVREKNNLGDTVLHVATAALDSKPLQTILALLSEPERLTVVKEKNNLGDTVLHAATTALYSKSLQKILALLPEPEHLTFVKEKNKQDQSVLHLITNNPESLKSILALYPEHERLTAIMEKDSTGRNVLMHALCCTESLQIILQLYPENNRLTAVKEINHKGNTALHLVAHDFESLCFILALYPEQERLAAVKEINHKGNTALHLVAHDLKSLCFILALYPEQERLAAVKQKNYNEKSVLYYAMHSPESLRIILTLYPEEKRLAAVIEQNIHGNSPLRRTFPKTSLQTILQLLPEKDRLAAVKIKDLDCNTLPHCTVQDITLLQTLLQSLTEEDRVAAITENIWGRTVFRYALRHPQSLLALLQSLPEKDRFTAVMKPDHLDISLLRHALEHPKSLLALLQSLPEKERFTAVMKPDHLGISLLRHALEHPISLQRIWQSLPQRDCFRALKESNQNGDTILQLAVSNPTLMPTIMNSLPEKIALEIVQRQVNRLANYANGFFPTSPLKKAQQIEKDFDHALLKRS